MTQTTDHAPSANAFEADKPRTAARSRIEAAIESVRQRGGVFVEAVRATRMAMVLTDPSLSGNPIIFANQAFLKVSGYGLDEVLGQQPFFMNGAGTDPEDAAEFRRGLEEDRDGRIETVQYRKDGSPFTANVLLSAFKDEAGQTLHHFLSWQDVTSRVEAESDVSELRRVEARLRESESRQTFLLELSDRLRSATDPREAMTAAAEMFARRTGLAIVHHLLFQPDQDSYDVVAGYSDGRMPASHAEQSGRLSDHGPGWGAQLRTGEAIFSDDHDSRPAADAKASRTFGVRSGSAVPLVRDGRLVAMLSTANPEPRRWTEEEKWLQREVAERTWAAVERTSAEGRLRQSEEQFRQFAETSSDVIWIRDADSLLFTYVGPAFETIYGEPLGDLKAGDDFERWGNLIHPDDRERAKTNLLRVSEGERITHEFRVCRADGALRWVRDTDFPLLDEHGRVKSVAGIGQDITELKQAQIAVAESERRVRNLVEGIPQLVWRAVDHGNWSWASPQWTAFTGQSEEASHGWGWLEPVHPDDHQSARESWERSKETGEFHAEYRVREAATGNYCWFQTRATPVRDDEGQLIEWLGTSTDVQALRELQQRQQLLLAELQHRVRNILAMIRSVVRRTVDGSPTVQDYAQHLEGRINAMARTQALLTRAPGQPIDLEDIVQAELLSVIAQEKKVWCEGPVVLLEPKAAEVLTLAIHELSTNSVKYGALSQQAGQLEIGWTIQQRGAERWLVFTWEEARIEGVEIDGRQGFGTELITRRVPYELGGTGTYELAPDGIKVTIECPLRPGSSILDTGATGLGGLT